MFYRLKDVFNRSQLNRVLCGILKTPPIKPDKHSTFALVSQIREKDILMYLLAVKSFCLWLRPSHVKLLVDGKLSQKSSQMLNYHIPNVVIEPHRNYRKERCPTGGTWERLLALASHAQDSYVVQLDADTVTLAPLQEVHNCISAEKAFTLGSKQGQLVEFSDVISRRAKESLSNGDTHIQTLSESVLDKFMPSQEIKYIRGCSAFVGIPRGKISPDSVADWAHILGHLIGSRWHEWGTEQFMCNLLIANMENSMVLPHPRYATCPNVSDEHTLFAHMAGFCRFSNHQYVGLAQRVIGML